MLQTESYFKELNPVKRKALLDAMTPEEDGQETYEQLKTLFERRYTPDKKGGYADNFIRAWLELKMLAENLDSYFAARSNKKRAVKALHTLCLDQTDLFDEHLLYREMCQLTALYISACNTDKNYQSFIWGLGKISDARLRGKINLDLERIGEAVPKYLDMEKECRILKTAILDTKAQFL